MKNNSVLRNLNFKSFIINKFLSPKDCKKIIQELKYFNKYDDLVMVGRKRINKGSINFKNFINRSPSSKKLFQKLNQNNFYNKLKKKFNKIPGKYEVDKLLDKEVFSKKISGSQKGNFITSQKTNLKKNIVYLDFDFSISNKGYSRGPHRDRDSRIFSFLIYLNNLHKVDGACLELYNVKKNVNYSKKRFLSKKKLKLVKKIRPSAGKMIIFASSPNSYHSVDNFYALKNKSRYFIYGSFSLNKKVVWRISHNGD